VKLVAQNAVNTNTSTARNAQRFVVSVQKNAGEWLHSPLFLMSKLTLGGIGEVLKKAGAGFMKDKVPKLSASLAYYTIFSMGPMLVVVIFLINLFLGRQAAEGTIYEEAKGLVGDQAAIQIQEIIRNAALSGANNLAAIIGFATLLIGATTVFSEIQDSINSIWKLKVKAKKGWLRMLINRLRSFSLVISLGFILLVSLAFNTLVEGFMDRLQELFPRRSVNIIYIVNLLLTLFIISTLFAIIFKVLPDAIIRWRDVAVGAFFTALLFMIGKFGITFYINNSDVGSTYGAAGSLAVLFVWVYFSSMILYFGAEFTKAYAVKYGAEIRPDEYAVIIQTVQVESKKSSVQENEEDTEKTEKELQKAKDELDEGVRK
jgi:membrane protein